MCLHDIVGKKKNMRMKKKKRLRIATSLHCQLPPTPMPCSVLFSFSVNYYTLFHDKLYVFFVMNYYAITELQLTGSNANLNPVLHLQILCCGYTQHRIFFMILDISSFEIMLHSLIWRSAFFFVMNDCFIVWLPL